MMKSPLWDRYRKSFEKSWCKVLTAGEGVTVYTIEALQKEAYNHLPKPFSADQSIKTDLKRRLISGSLYYSKFLSKREFMPIKYDDEKSYRFHKSDSADKCFTCNENSDRLLIVRQIKSMMLVHLCPNCIVNNSSDYLLDNTRPWLGEKGNI